MKNWYKEAKLVIKDGKIFVHCCYCHRWKTDDVNNPWKVYEEMNGEEKLNVDYIRAAFMIDKNKVPISHGVCNYCLSIIQKNVDISKDKVRELSLVN